MKLALEITAAGSAEVLNSSLYTIQSIPLGLKCLESTTRQQHVWKTQHRDTFHRLTYVFPPIWSCCRLQALDWAHLYMISFSIGWALGCLSLDWFAFPSVHVAFSRAAVSADVRPALRTNGIKDMLIAAQPDILPPTPDSKALSKTL